jgi:hypothetical protein
MTLPARRPLHTSHGVPPGASKNDSSLTLDVHASGIIDGEVVFVIEIKVRLLTRLQEGLSSPD